MDKEVKYIFRISVALVVIMGFLIFAVSGPAGISNSYQNWSANWSGSNWLIVLYSVNGKVINSWDIKDKAILNENDSDGIFFVGENGEVIHLSGHYVYVQNPTDKTRKELLKN